MGFLNASESWERVTEIQGNVSKPDAIAAIQDPDFIIELDLNHVSHEPAQPKNGKLLIPEDVKARATGETKCFNSTDDIPKQFTNIIPGKHQIVNHYQFTNISDGIFVSIQSPPDIKVMVEYKITGDDGNLMFVDSGGVEAVKPLVEVVVAQHDENMERVHSEFIKKAGGQPGAHK